MTPSRSMSHRKRTANHPKIVVLGGGTGSFTLLQSLKKVTPHVTAIVNMIDDGGSTGVLRDEYGVLPPGDVRQCLVALSDEPEARGLFNYRFGAGAQTEALAGHSLGNLILAGLQLRYGFAEAVRVASRMLQVQGVVLPVTLGDHHLVLIDGTQKVTGQSNIGNYQIQGPTPRILLEPKAKANPEAVAAIQQADLVVIAPGLFFGSILPVLAPTGIGRALQTTTAKKVMVTNLMTKPGHTDGWHVADFVRTLERHIGPGTIDCVLYNNVDPPDELIERYAAEGERPVAHDAARFAGLTVQAIGDDLVAGSVVHHQNPHDTAIRRTLIRHDSERTVQLLLRIFSPRLVTAQITQ